MYGLTEGRKKEVDNFSQIDFQKTPTRNSSVMQLSLLHPLGTMSHRVKRGAWNEKKQT